MDGPARHLGRGQLVRLFGDIAVRRAKGDPSSGLRGVLERYGPAFRIRSERGWLGRGTSGDKVGEVWVITDPAMLEVVLIKKHRSFAKDPLTQELEDVLGQGLLVSEGKTWSFDHRLVQPAMTAVAMRRRSAEVAAVVDDALRDWPASGDVEAMKLLGPVTLEVVARVMLGVSLADKADLVGAALDQILAYYAGGPGFRAPKAWRMPARRRFEAAVSQLRGVTTTLIERRAARPCTPEDPDALGRLIATHRVSPDALPWSRVHDQAITLMLAGNETTTIGLSSALHALGANPPAQARWHEESDAMRGTPFDPDRVPWIRAVWRETLRLNPPAPGVGRVAKEAVDLGGLTVPPRGLVVVPAMGMHRMPAWFPNPDAFEPGRFIDPPT